MPALIPVALGIGGAIAGVYGAKKSSEATENASTLSKESSDKAIALQTSQDAETKREFDAQQSALQNQWNAEQSIKAPYRAVGQQALSNIGSLLGQNFAPAIASASSAAPVLPSSATAPTSTATTPTSSSSNPLDPSAINAQLNANYQALGVKPTGPGTGPTDSAYYAQKIAQTGGLTPQNISYWFGPSGRIASDLGKSGTASGGGSTLSPAMTAQQKATSTPSVAMPLSLGDQTPFNAAQTPYTPVIPMSALLRTS